MKTHIKKIHAAIDKLFTGVFYLGGGMLMILILLCFASVFARAVGNPIYWIEETQRYVLVAMSMLLAPVLSARKGHLVVDMTSVLFPQKLRRTVFLIGDTIMLIFVLIATPAAFQLVTKNANVISAAMQVSMKYFYICIPIGFTLIAVAVAKNLLADFF